MNNTIVPGESSILFISQKVLIGLAWPPDPMLLGLIDPLDIFYFFFLFRFFLLSYLIFFYTVKKK
jgi:hypothetical protein